MINEMHNIVKAIWVELPVSAGTIEDVEDIKREWWDIIEWN